VIVDTSAIVAIVRGEPDAVRLAETMVENAPLRISAGTLLELGIVIDGSDDPVASRKLDEIVKKHLDVVPFSADHATLARDAYRDFGKGSGHPAKLNFGDCFAYALAAAAREPLLYKGDDFGHTDIRPALPPD
jgi:ribonuclease VapC